MNAPYQAVTGIQMAIVEWLQAAGGKLKIQWVRPNKPVQRSFVGIRMSGPVLQGLNRRGLASIETINGYDFLVLSDAGRALFDRLLAEGKVQ